MNAGRCVVLIGAALAASGARGAVTQWLMSGGDGAQSWNSALAGPDHAGRMWKLRLDEDCFGQPVIGGDGTIYVTTTAGTLWAVNPNGAARWTFAGGGIASTSPAIGNNGTIHYAAGNRLIAVSPTGQQLWSYAMSLPAPQVFSAPLVGSDGAIYVSTHGGLYCVNPNGTLRYKKTYPDGGGILLTADGGVIQQTSETLVAPVRRHNAAGAEVWKKHVDSYLSARLTFARGGSAIYVGQYDAKLYKLDLATGNIIDTHQLKHTGPAGISVGADGSIYVTTDGGVEKLSEGGQSLWHVGNPASTRAGPGVLDRNGDFYVSQGQAGNGIFSISPDGVVRWTFLADESNSRFGIPVILSEGVVVAGSWDYETIGGYLYAIPEPGMLGGVGIAMIAMRRCRSVRAGV